MWFFSKLEIWIVINEKWRPMSQQNNVNLPILSLINRAKSSKQHLSINTVRSSLISDKIEKCSLMSTFMIITHVCKQYFLKRYVHVWIVILRINRDLFIDFYQISIVFFTLHGKVLIFEHFWMTSFDIVYMKNINKVQKQVYFSWCLGH